MTRPETSAALRPGTGGEVEVALLERAQPAAFDALTRAVVDDAVAHAWLLVGPAGVGQAEAARYLGAALNCEVGGGRAAPCTTCRTCHQVLSGVHTAVRDFAPTGAEHRVADVRETWIPMATTTSIGGAKKVLRIEAADRMNEQTQNAFLKVLEEPPASTVWILDVADDAALLDTIVSRCRRLDLRPWPRALLGDLLDGWAAAGDGDPGVGSGEEPSAAAIAASAGRAKPVDIDHLDTPSPAERQALVRLSRGSPALLRELSTCPGRRLRASVCDVVGVLARSDVGTAGSSSPGMVSDLMAHIADAVHRVQLANKAELFELGVTLGVHDADGKKTRGGSFPAGMEKRETQRHHRREREAQNGGIRLTLDLLGAYVRDLIAVASGGGDEAVNNTDRLSDLQRQAGSLPGVAGLVDVLAAVEEGHRGLEQNANPKLALERPVLRLVMALHFG